MVAPLVGAWIEIKSSGREHDKYIVAPLVGAWIEISIRVGSSYPFDVAPLVGAWIEITAKVIDKLKTMSLPSWERGLKFQQFVL